ncbi:MAG TPA: hypothetical protein VMJ32_03360 [Pirellulales bacterium]|nr:hypothetical protein [Pirellulales bacterium]
MVLEQEIQPYSVWFQQALWNFGETAFFVVLAALIISYLVAAFRYGPLPAGDRLYRAVVGAIVDLVHISPRRVWALVRLAVQEAIRRRIWAALIAFVVILMFAGWFLDPSSPEPGPLYLKFVMSWTTYLVVLMALFISAFSLPNDIKNRTITTIVTKPVRTAEIVLGRIVGFTLICTTLLAVMGFCSYVFVVRSLAHTHDIHPEDINAAALDPAHLQPGRIGTTQIAQNHQHDVILKPDGTLETDFKHGHIHHITVKEVNGKKQYTVGPQEGMLTARLPLMGQLRFLDRDGQPKEKGINVGKEWDYRGFVDGNTQSAAIWTFDNINEDTLFPNTPAEKRTLPLKWTIRVFRTYKGNIEKGITGKLVLINPTTQLQSEPIIFTVKEFTLDGRDIDRKLMKAGAAESDPPIDLFKDLVSNGQLEIKLQCLEPGQLLGVAAPDLYISAGEASFELNFAKGYVGIWCQMVLVIGLGVMFSTFLSGAVAMIATLGCLVLGYFSDDIVKIFESLKTGNRRLVAGGGPVESFVRLITQKSITAPYDDSPTIEIMYWIDKVLMRFMTCWTDVLPDFSSYSNVHFVASGFNVPGDLLLEQLTRMATFLFAAFIAGFLFLRMREVAR